jgi:predicted 2-oxoglutarate/Fe(II)-dependent dioxygenase YbiX
MVEKGDVVQARSTVIASVTPETRNRRTENLMDAR